MLFFLFYRNIYLLTVKFNKDLLILRVEKPLDGLILPACNVDKCHSCSGEMMFAVYTGRSWTGSELFVA